MAEACSSAREVPIARTAGIICQVPNEWQRRYEASIRAVEDERSNNDQGELRGWPRRVFGEYPYLRGDLVMVGIVMLGAGFGELVRRFGGSADAVAYGARAGFAACFALLLALAVSVFRSRRSRRS